MATVETDDEATGIDAEPEPPRRRGWIRPRLIAVIAVIAVAALVAWGEIADLRAQTAPPSTSSAEAGFARDMQVHHQQAVELALLIRDRTEDPAIRTFAYDVATTQSQQAGQLYGWLSLWDLPQASPGGKRMAWMRLAPLDGSSPSSMADMSSMPGMSGSMPRMPGAVSRADIDRLRAATGVEAERIFLELLITHHRGGVQMAESVLARTRNPVVSSFAQAIITAQSSEMSYMRGLLAERGGAG